MHPPHNFDTQANRVSYALMADEQIDFNRPNYDIPAVVEKVKAIDELSDFLGQRLP